MLLPTSEELEIYIELYIMIEEYVIKCMFETGKWRSILSQYN